MIALIQASILALFLSPAAGPAPEPAASSDYCSDASCCRMYDPVCEQVELYAADATLVDDNAWKCADAGLAGNVCYWSTHEPTCTPMEGSPFTVCC